MEVTKKPKVEFEFKLTLTDGSVYTFSATAENEKEAKEKILKNLQEAKEQLLK